LLVDYLEEDFRFATKSQVAAYSADELQRKPHIHGYDLAQLLDQLDGRVFSSRVVGKRLSALIQAPGGTALCIAKHMIQPGGSIRSYFYPDLTFHLTSHFDNTLISQLQGMTGVSEVLYDLGRGEYPSKFSYGCVVLSDLGAGTVDYTSWPDVIAYDPGRSCKDKAGGGYFMNSSIWTNCGY